MSNQNTIPASVAMLRVLEAWGVKHVYGYQVALLTQRWQL